MFIRVFGQSVALLLSQWIFIKWILTTGTVEQLGDYFFYLSILAPIYMLLTGHFKNYAAQSKIESWDVAWQLRKQQLFLLIISVATTALLLGVFYELSVFLFVIAATFKAVEVSLDTRQAFEIRKASATGAKSQKSSPIAFGSAAFLFIVLISVWLSSAEQNISSATLIGVMALLLAINFGCSRALDKESTKEQEDEEPKLKNVLINVGLPALVIALIAAVPRLSLEWLATSEDLAVFGSFLYFYLLSNIITISLFQSRIRHRKNADLYTPLAILMGTGCFGLYITSLFHSEIITLIFSGDLATYSDWLPWFVGFIIVSAVTSYLEQTLIGRLSGRFMLRLNLLILLGALIFCPILVTHYQLLGAVIYMYGLFIIKSAALLLHLNKGEKHGQLAV